MSAYYETKIHGSRDFPYAIYKAVLPKFFSSYPLHWHEELEIIYVKKGKICVTVENNDIIAGEGELAVIHPQTIHSIKQYNDEKAVYYNVLFRLSLLESTGGDICRSKYLEPIYSKQLIMPEYIGKDNPLLDKISPLIDTLTENPPQFSADKEFLIKAKVFEIMHYLKDSCISADKSERELSGFYEKLKTSLLYLEDNYAENISVADAAAMSNFSSSYFSKLFRELTGSSFTQYLKNYRLERAAEKIRDNGMRVSEAAVSCGFENLSYFTRAFREKFGVTPKDFKKGIRAVR